MTSPCPARLRGWQEGFTIFELILVILIAGLAAIQAIRTFEDLSQQAKRAHESAVALRVRTGIDNYFVDSERGNKTQYPVSLDRAESGQCSSSNSCFDQVAPAGIGIESWWKVSERVYRSDVSGTNSWQYYPETGAFVKTED